VLDFSWEPKGERFAIVSSNDPNLGNPGPGVTIKTDVSFYQLDHGKNDFRLLRQCFIIQEDSELIIIKFKGTLPSRTSNAIRWSPRGRHVVLATVGSSSKSELEFWDLDFNSDDAHRKDSQADWGSGIQLLGSADHYGVTDVEWDPSGRYLATSASAWTHTVCYGVLHRKAQVFDFIHSSKMDMQSGISEARNLSNTFKTDSNNLFGDQDRLHFCRRKNRSKFAEISENIVVRLTKRTPQRRAMSVLSSSLSANDWSTNGTLGARFA